MMNRLKSCSKQIENSTYSDENSIKQKSTHKFIFRKYQTERKKFESSSDLSIREGTFSEDIITTGISLRDADAYKN
jgi:hypothetical protein